MRQEDWLLVPVGARRYGKVQTANGGEIAPQRI